MKTIGEYLVEDGAITPTQVETALAKQRDIAARGEKKRFGEVLLEMRLVSTDQLQRAIDRQQLERT
ncbi:MAG TPA: hypothetical protein VGA16_05195 [Candidatus Limnocylindria bacterium]